jgi:hypothetical protein
MAKFSLSARHAVAMAECGGGCPIEAGAIGRMADHECRHGRLPFDPTPACGCCPQEGGAVSRAAPRADTLQPASAGCVKDELARRGRRRARQASGPPRRTARASRRSPSAAVRRTARRGTESRRRRSGMTRSGHDRARSLDGPIGAATAWDGLGQRRRTAVLKQRVAKIHRPTVPGVHRNGSASRAHPCVRHFFCPAGRSSTCGRTPLAYRRIRAMCPDETGSCHWHGRVGQRRAAIVVFMTDRHLILAAGALLSGGWRRRYSRGPAHPPPRAVPGPRNARRRITATLVARYPAWVVQFIAEHAVSLVEAHFRGARELTQRPRRSATPSKQVIANGPTTPTVSRPCPLTGGE